MRILLICAFLSLNSTMSYGQLPVEVASDQSMLIASKNPQLAANKKIVFDFWREVLQTRDMTDAKKYLAEDYIQHNPNVPTGRQAFVDFFGKLQRQPLKSGIDNLVSIVAENDLVILAIRRELPDPDDPKTTYTSTWFDMFRLKDNMIVEHWDYGTRAAKNRAGLSKVQCQALCTFRRKGGAIERLDILQQANTADEAWKKLQDTCAGITCRKCKWDLVASLADAKDYELRNADQVNDCKTVRTQ